MELRSGVHEFCGKCRHNFPRTEGVICSYCNGFLCKKDSKQTCPCKKSHKQPSLKRLRKTKEAVQEEMIDKSALKEALGQGQSLLHGFADSMGKADDIEQMSLDALEGSEKIKKYIDASQTKICELKKELRTRNVELQALRYESKEEISKLHEKISMLEKDSKEKMSMLEKESKEKTMFKKVLEEIHKASKDASLISTLAIDGNIKAAYNYVSESKMSTEDEEQSKLSDCNVVYYYPSSIDEDKVEITSKDLACLEPGKWLSSNVMNFYIRYLELASSSKTMIHNCHFFNTYFFRKLQTGYDVGRWWKKKNVNLTEKTCIFVPINEICHWSLAIVFRPTKEKKLVILHMDSNGVHNSAAIFDSLKCSLKKEWSDIQEIDVERLQVPQQKNGDDCGLFVLSYMERFLKEAPKWLTKNCLSKLINKQWFPPEEASELRSKIRDLLQELMKLNSNKAEGVTGCYIHE